MVRGSSHIGDAIILRIYTNAFPPHAHLQTLLPHPPHATYYTHVNVPHHKSIYKIYTHILCYVLGGNLLDKAFAGKETFPSWNLNLSTHRCNSFFFIKPNLWLLRVICGEQRSLLIGGDLFLSSTDIFFPIYSIRWPEWNPYNDWTA